MDFHINRGATLPELRMELIRDGRNDFRSFYDSIQNSTLQFSMSELATGTKVLCKAGCFTKKPDSGCGYEEYYIGYKFEAGDTDKAGIYVGQFTIEFQDGSGKLIVPIREELYIHILEGSIKK